MIYQFDCNGKMIASHKSARAAAERIQQCTPYDVANNIYTWGIDGAALCIAQCCHSNDTLQALRWLCYGYYWSSYSFMSEL
jgi:hypothetical protein